ncbi:MAG TPA: tetratricopeptide repeat protein, partial [Gemmatimonadales bacterium]|nr:tetratricopeptide repeat protein [Gemmatimonadales bacterium]
PPRAPGPEPRRLRTPTTATSDWPGAWREFELAAGAAPANDVLFYNLGLIFRQAGLAAEALQAFERSHALNPRPIASLARADAMDRVTEMRLERDRVRALEGAFPGGPPPPAGPARAEWHRQMARWLDARDEQGAARGHRLRALVLESD